jgi:bifunctional non-homologous end joining protein LigD
MHREFPAKGIVMLVSDYRRKRRFDVTPEPAGSERRPRPGKRPLAYVIQKHRASHLHYDFRLEWNGVLLSWAVPKGPSLDPTARRLATAVEDHPLEYRRFEGVIPEGEYGGGTVMLWDRGWWTPDRDDVDAALADGELTFTLHGKKLKGSWVLVRTRSLPKSQRRRGSWLLVKRRDSWASKGSDVALAEPRSIATGRLLADIAREEGGDVAKASTGDPAAPARTARGA